MITISAPSNIALIKYMGKSNSLSNIPTNSSLSYTLNQLRTRVEIQKIESDSADEWAPLVVDSFFKLELSLRGQEKFLNHFAKMKKELGISGQYRVLSANNFPSDAGLASSASSFAALTQACYLLKKSQDKNFEISTEDLADLSRQGSGSSCRSFFSPWSIWDQKGVREIKLATQDLEHMVLVFETRAKEVSSSEAHKRVLQSPLFKKDSSGLSRSERAEGRLYRLINSLQEGQWSKSYEICWDEFWDMHELFHTSLPSFSYLTEEVRNTLSRMQERWKNEGTGPLITLDAGPNIHCLFRKSDKDLAKSWKDEFQPQGQSR